MAYEHVTLVAADGDLQQRLIACAASEGIDQPEAWVAAHRWDFATQPGWADAYQSAIISYIDRPGWRPDFGSRHHHSRRTSHGPV